MISANDEIQDVLMTGVERLPERHEIRSVYLESEDYQKMEPHTITQIGGKTRTITIHPAEEVQVARELTACWLSVLRQTVVTRDSLNGHTVAIRPQTADSLAFSADLSKATDYMPHALARYVGLCLCNKLNRPQDIPVVNKLFSPKRLPDGTLTNNGVHMGLGPSWVILSLLNSFAAWHAGARRNTYAVCGDDLIGFWPKRICERYSKLLEELGLKVNRSKSFYGRYGVFCERIMEPRANHESSGLTKLVSKDVGHLSDLTAAKVHVGFNRHPLAIVAGMGSSPYLDRRQVARQRLLPRGTGSGRVENYGNGRGALCNRGMLHLVQGRTGLDVKLETLPETVSKQLAESQTENGSIPVSDFLISYKTASRLNSLINGVEKPTTRPLTIKEFKARSRLITRGTQPSDKQLISAIRASSFSQRNKSAATWLLSSYANKMLGRTTARRRLARILMRPRAARYITEEVFNSLISISGLHNRELGLHIENNKQRRCRHLRALGRLSSERKRATRNVV
jgi:hypothetical protein